MKQPYIRRNRELILPWVKDWKDPHDDLRYQDDVTKLTHKEWLYFHPSAYKLVLYYGSDSSIITSSTTANIILLFTVGFGIWNILFTGIAILYMYKLINKIRKRESVRNLNIYDLYMRDD